MSEQSFAEFRCIVSYEAVVRISFHGVKKLPPSVGNTFTCSVIVTVKNKFAQNNTPDSGTDLLSNGGGLLFGAKAPVYHQPQAVLFRTDDMPLRTDDIQGFALILRRRRILRVVRSVIPGITQKPTRNGRFYAG